MPDPLLKFRRVHITAPDGTKYRFYAPATKRAADATDDGHSDAAEDIYIGGGGGIAAYTITTLFNADYFGAKPRGQETTAPEVKVAKSVPSRLGFGPYSYSSAVDNGRVSNNGSDSETQVMVPPFVAGDLVFVATVDHTGVTVSGTELTLLEVNTEREWCVPCNKVLTTWGWMLTL